MTLKEDIREDDAQAVIDAIRLLKPVIDVTPIEGGYDQSVAESRVRRELGGKLWEVLYPKTSKRRGFEHVDE